MSEQQHSPSKTSNAENPGTSSGDKEQNTGKGDSHGNTEQTPPEYESFKNSDQSNPDRIDVDEGTAGDRFEGTDRTGAEEKPHGDTELNKGLESQAKGGEG